jgi:hypothetical protein
MINLYDCIDNFLLLTNSKNETSLSIKSLYMYEHKKQPLLPLRSYYGRLFKHILIALGVISVWLAIGSVCYHFTDKVQWIDAFHNASMIVSGMGPVIEFHTVEGKLFSSIYALISGILFIGISGIILAPVIHRLFHRLHLEK